MIVLTDAARDKIAELLDGMPDGGIRIVAILSACAGIRYMLSYAEASAKGDTIVRDGGAAVFLDPGSAASLAGTVVDFVTGAGGGGFTFANPNAVGRCSCGDPNAACASQRGAA